MGDQVGRLTERLAADDALVRLLTGVDVGVLLHVRLLMESFAAVLARVRAGVRVDEQVGGERRGAFERLAALVANEVALGSAAASAVASDALSHYQWVAVVEWRGGGRGGRRCRGVGGGGGERQGRRQRLQRGMTGAVAENGRIWRGGEIVEG